MKCDVYIEGRCDFISRFHLAYWGQLCRFGGQGGEVLEQKVVDLVVLEETVGEKIDCLLKDQQQRLRL